MIDMGMDTWKSNEYLLMISVNGKHGDKILNDEGYEYIGGYTKDKMDGNGNITW